MEYSNIIVSILLLLIGILFRLFQPKSINSFYGYRTPASRRNIENWKFANLLASKILIKFAIILVIIAFLFEYIEVPNTSSAFVSLLVTGLLLLILIVEMKLSNLKK